MSVWFPLTNVAFDWMHEVHAKDKCEANLFPPCVDEHHYTASVCACACACVCTCVRAVLCRSTFDGIRGTARRTPQYTQCRSTLRAVRRSIRSAAVHCGELYCVVESRSGVNRLEMRSTLQICFQILGKKLTNVMMKKSVQSDIECLKCCPFMWVTPATMSLWLAYAQLCIKKFMPIKH